MEYLALKENFTNQLKEIDDKIIEIQNELKKAQEYKLKLIGGLETLELLEKSETSNIEPPLPKNYVDPVVAEDINDPKYKIQKDKDGKEEVVIIEEH
jgi:hypothetical protein